MDDTYPRKTLRCAVHVIPKLDNLSDSLYPTDNDLIVGLNYLRNQNSHIVKGDVLYYESQSDCYHLSQGFFDGEKVIPLDPDIGEFGGLPKQFHVIEDNVPIRYWEDAINSIVVYFDHLLVQKECVDNIKYDLLEEGIYGIFTNFVFNNKDYKIIWTIEDEDDFDLISEIEKFKTMLLQKESIQFSIHSMYPKFNTLKDNENILYI
ncbi:MAG TPA: hypothetical protein VLG50_05665 [Candidatus Saccharimonadales bacterium]|nr:hypothetical protein [Candidatus Saccharimonadales bacterium]